MCLVVPFAPEFILMSELGGIELVFSFLVLYYNKKYQARQMQAKPILEKLYHWLTKQNKTKQNIVPKSALGKAIKYNVNQ
jgi:hypothetical protein